MFVNFSAKRMTWVMWRKVVSLHMLQLRGVLWVQRKACMLLIKLFIDAFISFWHLISPNVSYLIRILPQVLMYLGCCNRTPQATWLNRNLLSQFKWLQVHGQGAIMIDFWWGHSSLITDGYLVYLFSLSLFFLHIQQQRALSWLLFL
jgi:hypothetical protein